MKDWCEKRKQEGFESVYMWGFVVIGDIGAFEAWSINHLQHPFEKKFAPDVGEHKKGKKRKNLLLKTRCTRPLVLSSLWDEIQSLRPCAFGVNNVDGET